MVNEQPSPAPADPAAPSVDPALPPIDQSALPPLPPGYVWAYPSISEPESRWKAPRWLVALTILWAVGLVVAGTVYALRGSPSVREQTTVANAQPTVNTAITNVIRAAGPLPIVAIGGYGKSSGCDITPVRAGVEYTQIVDVFVSPGTESAALNTIANGLPTSYAAKAGPGNVLTLYADAGDYVGLVGAVPSPGEIEIKAETGCRQVGPAIPATPAPSLGSTEMTPVRSVLNTIGVLASSTSAAQIPCAGSGVLRTVTARGPAPTVTTSLAVQLATIAKHPTVSTANLVAYRTGTTDVVAAKDPTGVTVSATTRCPGP
ncbi:MAG TPA: hypothetical protein VGF84_19875 [Micromonosporaceae bacterium]